MKKTQVIRRLPGHVQRATSRMHQQADFHLLHGLRQGDQETPVVFVKFEESIDVHPGFAKKLTLLDRRPHVRRPAVLIESLLPEVGVVFRVHQGDVVQLGQQGVGIDARAGRLLHRPDHCPQLFGAFAASFQLGEGLIELSRQSDTRRAAEELQPWFQFSQQMAQNHLAAQRSDQRNRISAARFEYVPAKLFEGDNACPAESPEAGGACQIALALNVAWRGRIQ